MIYATRGGVKLAYRDIGDGTDPIILIHGWACEHSFLMPQLKHLSQSYRVLAVDLCGHGASDVPDREYTLAEFADDIEWLSTTLNLPPAVIVGHSMGGAVALELAGSHPEKVSAVCLIDSVLFPSESFLSQMRQVECELAGPNFPEALIQVVSSLFLETDNRVTRAQILRKMGRVPKHVVLASFPSHLLNYNFTAAADACKVPELSNAG